jgi:hypothetical protein
MLIAAKQIRVACILIKKGIDSSTPFFIKYS